MVAILDVAGHSILTVGLFLVGSGFYQVIFSSVIVFAAIYNRVFLKRSMPYMSWAAVFLITFGLAVNVLGAGKLHVKGKVHQLDETHRLVIGFAVTLAGTAIFSGVYTLNDALMSSSKSALPR